MGNKLTLNDVGNLQNESSVVTTLAQNNRAIETAIENTLSRDGTSPNTMQNNLDMNSKRIINLPAPVGDTDVVRLIDVADLGNVTINTLPSGGTTGQSLTKTSNVDYAIGWSTVNTSPGGSTTQLQYNNAGAFGGVTGATSNGTVLTLTSPAITTPTGLVKGDVGLGNVDNTSDATKNSASATLTNKTINGANNTITGVSLATGVTGNLPVTNLNSGTSASSTTFWRGDATWASVTGSTIYDTRTAVQAATIPGSVNVIFTAGYAAIGDGGGSIDTNASYKRVGSLPSHSGYIQSADGAYWELTGPWVSVKQFGAVAVVSNLDTDPDSAAAINLCMAYCNLKKSNMFIPSGQWALDSAITSPTFIIQISGSQGTGQPTVIYKRYVEAGSKGVISLGAWGATITDLQFAAKATASGGAAISAILPGNAANIGVLRMGNIYVSGGNGYNNDILIDGSANVNASGPGYRSVFMNNSHLFGSAVTPVYLVGVEHMFADNFFIATTGGSVSSGFVVIIDGSTSAYSDDIHFSGGLISGNVNMNNAHRSTFMARTDGNISVASNCDTITFLNVGGTATLNGTDTVVLNGTAWTVATPTPTSSTGTLTSASSVVAYKKVGKTVHCVCTITVTTAGTGGGSLQVQLPFTLLRATTTALKENAVNGQACVASILTSGLVGILKYDNNTNIVSGGSYPFSFTAELA